MLYREALGFLQMSPEGAYEGYCIPDYMINYQGGFVRRGLLGELLLQAFQIHPFAVHEVVYFMDKIFLLFLVVVSFPVFKKMGWYPIFPLAIFMSTPSYRRDFLMIAISYFIFDNLLKYIKYKKALNIFLCMLLMVLSILLYEPSFFFIVPISIIIFWFGMVRQIPRKESTMQTISVFVLPIVSFGVVCLAKGSTEMAAQIWRSWQPMFDYVGTQYQPETIPAAIDFLGKSTTDVILFHLKINYQYLSRILGSIAMFVCSYYLTTRALQKRQTEQYRYILLSDIYIFQFICLLPMFSILSCDFGRTIYYVIMTSYFLTFLLVKHETSFSIPIIHKWSESIQSLLSSHKLFNHIAFYLFVLFIMPYNICCGVPITHPLIREYIPMLLPKIQLILSMLGL